MIKAMTTQHIHETMNSQFLRISLLSMIAAWRLHRLVPMESASNPCADLRASILQDEQQVYSRRVLVETQIM
jgi:hypothetical protein